MITHKFAVSGLVSPARHQLLFPAALQQNLPVGDAPETVCATLVRMGEQFPELICIVFYEAPWQALDELLARDPARFMADPVAALTLWLNFYKEILRLRRTLGPRLILLNASHTGGRDALLRQYLQQQYGVELGAEPATQSAFGGVGGVGSVGEANPALAMVLSKVFEWVAPECHDLYEALESCALLLGREPEFRQTVSEPSADSLQALLMHWTSAHNVPGLQAELAALRQTQGQTLATMKSEVEQTNLALKKAHAVNQGLQTQFESVQAGTNELLQAERQTVANLRQQRDALQHEANQALLQLEQAQSELARVFHEQQTLAHEWALERAAAAQNQMASADARLAWQNQCAALGVQNESMARQLQQLTDSEREVAQLAQAAQQSAQESAQQLAAAQQALEQVRAALRLEQTQADEMLLRLHETQENLETRHLENIGMQALLGQAQGAFARARSVLARVIVDRAA